ncbi:MAG: hypothetical protein OEZ68_14955 [Gammaproteobacteria bacterium]|nr:hypothetical protein [Gammaproteobacteria bacterium]MDH5802100.1 hypothetical protein [Gammaproteobacteria bacterium]
MQTKASVLVVVAMVAVVVSQFVIAVPCYEDSPLVAEGHDVYTIQDVPPMTSEEYDAIKSILERSTGNWSGEMSEDECLGSKNNPRVKSKRFSVSGESHFDGEKFELKLNYASQNNSDVRKTITFILKPDQFQRGTAGPKDLAQVMSTSKNAFTFYARIIYEGRGTMVREFADVVHLKGDQLVLQTHLYVGGVYSTLTKIVLTH